MKLDRFAAILLVGLLSLGLLAAGKEVPKKFEYRIGKNHEVEKVEVKDDEPSTTKALAQALAQQVQQVQDRFAAKRKALRILSGRGNAQGYLLQDVTGLVGDTRKDLDQAIQSVQPSGTEPLRAWADDQFQQVQGKIPPPGATALLPGASTPRATAVFASFQGFGTPVFAKNKPVPPKKKAAPPKTPPPPKPQTIPVATADSLLDQVEQVVRKIFVLADDDDLEVNLWVGSTPAKKARFRFWPQGGLQGSTPAPRIIETAGQRDHVMRGLYSYEADLEMGRGAVTLQIKYPDPTAPLESERLDLVMESRFFCCQFGQRGYCHHVNDEKDCH